MTKREAEKRVVRAAVRWYEIIDRVLARYILNREEALRAHAQSQKERADRAEKLLRLKELEAPPIDRDEKIRALEDSVRRHCERADRLQAELAEARAAVRDAEERFYDETKGYGDWLIQHAAAIAKSEEQK